MYLKLKCCFKYFFQTKCNYKKIPLLTKMTSHRKKSKMHFYYLSYFCFSFIKRFSNTEKTKNIYVQIFNVLQEFSTMFIFVQYRRHDKQSTWHKISTNISFRYNITCTIYFRNTYHHMTYKLFTNIGKKCCIYILINRLYGYLYDTSRHL